MCLAGVRAFQHSGCAHHDKFKKRVAAWRLRAPSQIQKSGTRAERNRRDAGATVGRSDSITVVLHRAGQGAISVAANSNQQLETPAVTQGRTALFKTRALIVTSVICQVAGNAMLSHGLHHQETAVSSSFMHYVYAILNPWAIAGVVVLCCWMISNLSLLSRADLSYVLPITGSMSFILIALVGHFVLHEHVSWVHWVGICTITVGVLLVLETSPLTVTVHDAPEDER